MSTGNVGKDGGALSGIDSGSCVPNVPERAESVRAAADELQPRTSSTSTPQKDISVRSTAIDVGQLLAKRFESLVSRIVEDLNPDGIAGLYDKKYTDIRDMQGRVTKEVAASCFDRGGKINEARVTALCNFLANRGNFRGEPYDSFPCFEHMRFQMHAALDSLQNSAEFKETLNLLNEGEELTSSLGETLMCPQGKAFMDAAFPGMGPGQAILASLLSPHRQGALPTCTINARINNMTFNRPQQLVKMYISMLSNWEFNTPSGYPVPLPPFANGHVSVDLEHGETGRNDVFKNITSGDRKKIADQLYAWQDEGISYDATSQYKLGLPARDLTDLCFAGLFQATFGDARVNANRTYGTMHVFNGFKLSATDFFHFSLPIEGQNGIPKVIRELQGAAGMQREQDSSARYMLIDSVAKMDGGEFSGHTENIDIARLLALDLDKMQNGEVYCIGDSNYIDPYNCDIAHLAISKQGSGDSAAYQLGSAYCAGNRRVRTAFFEGEFVGLFVVKTEVRPL